MTITTHPASRRARPPFGRSALGVGLLLVLTAACGESEPEPAAPPAAEAPAAKAPAPAAPQASEIPDAGSVKIGENSLPEGFPEDLPIYPDAQPSRWLAGEGAGALVAFDTDADPAAVYRFFVTELAGQGWEIETKTETPSHSLLVAAKAGRKVRISIAAGPQGGSLFGVAVAEGG